jgi:hypothetical protein
MIVNHDILMVCISVLMLPLAVSGFNLPQSPDSSSMVSSRSDFFRNSATSAAGWMIATTVSNAPARATESTPPAKFQDKLVNLPDGKLKEIIRTDVVQNQFLCNGKLTRSVYDESATFTDEIDTYQLDQWIKGTQKLFNGDNSEVRLVGDVLVSKAAVEFRFDEDLQFNVPLKPTVALTGKVILQRDPDTGLITSYQEVWDQDVATVLKSAKFGGKK